ncbi:hypothetical protein AGMMS4956_07790 [Bacteroidia bacterium]|nr:hypothetical protein AGMMS4956_07790 [Bacteroidia bacterium]
MATKYSLLTKALAVLLVLSIAAGCVLAALQTPRMLVAPALFAVFLLLFWWLVGQWQQDVSNKKIPLAPVANYFMMWKMAKMFVCVVGLFIYIKFNKDQFLPPFLILFAVYYIEFMLLEIVTLRDFQRINS